MNTIIIIDDNNEKKFVYVKNAELESEIPVCKINFRFSISLARLNSGKLKLLYFSGS